MTTTELTGTTVIHPCSLPPVSRRCLEFRQYRTVREFLESVFYFQALEENLSPIDAALKAARLRLRPILMTSLAFILGVLPMVIATGPGASARQSMGTGVFGGMILSTLIATLFVPVFFTWFVRTRKKRL